MNNTLKNTTARNFFSVILAALFLSCALSHAAENTPQLPFTPGETIEYSIKKLKVNWGTATIVFDGPTTIDGHTTFLITFISKGIKFFDEEKIYMDPVTFLPIRVERNLDILGKKEKIIEYYDAPNGTVRIVKTAKGETTEQIIRKSPPLDNIYCFIYRFRATGNFASSQKIQLNLPTQDVQFSLEGRKKVSIAGEDLDAYYMESKPAKYRVWFDAGQRKIPLRIDGAMGLGKTAMIMKKYTK